MGWVSPTGGGGPFWANAGNAYDENESSFAISNTGVDWSFWIELTVPPLLCDKIRFNALYNTLNVTSVEVQVYYDGTYHSVYTGAFLNHAWVEKDVIPGSPGRAKTVSKMKLRFFRITFTAAMVYEADFNQAQSVIANMMKHYRNMRTE